MIKTGSLFTQVLSLVDRNNFSRAVHQWDAEKGAKGFRCWDQFVAMVFCQLAGADSLREICGGLSTAMGKLAHIGLKQAPCRSTLSYANEHRPWQLFEMCFTTSWGRLRSWPISKSGVFSSKTRWSVLMPRRLTCACRCTTGRNSAARKGPSSCT